MKIDFVKMHGLGNDFVIVSEQAIADVTNLKNFIKDVSERNTGIGCDQVIIYDEHASNIPVKIYNRNASKALACGNAMRCLSRLIFDTKKQDNIQFLINDRLVNGKFISRDKIVVNMGPVEFYKNWMPSIEQICTLAKPYQIEPKEMLCVDVGNPHLVIFSNFSKEDQEVIGSQLQKSDIFPDGINVNFATLKPNHTICLTVWERGTGITNSCGSGAIATFAAANKLGFVDNKTEIIFDLGTLTITKTVNDISMCGPASYICFGEFFYENK